MKACKQCKAEIPENRTLKLCNKCYAAYQANVTANAKEESRIIYEYRQKEEKPIILSEYELTNDRFNLLRIEDISKMELRRIEFDFRYRNQKIRILHRYHRCFKKNVPRNKRGRKRDEGM